MQKDRVVNTEHAEERRHEPTLPSTPVVAEYTQGTRVCSSAPVTVEGDSIETEQPLPIRKRSSSADFQKERGEAPIELVLSEFVVEGKRVVRRIPKKYDVPRFTSRLSADSVR
jgi:hypothetical protein